MPVTRHRSRGLALVTLVLLGGLSACDVPAAGGPRGRGGRGGDAGVGGGGGGDTGVAGDPWSDAATGGGPSDDAGPGAEIACDGIDDDRDGVVDDGCSCDTDLRQACYGGDPRVAGVGACAFGSQPCIRDGEFGSWGACDGWVPPSLESCGGGDEDCDGIVDEGCGCAVGATESCYETASGAALAGTPGVGVCRAGAASCVGSGGSSAFGACVGAIGPSDEVCGNGIDDDCDGSADEGCSCTVGREESCYESPSGAPLGGAPGVGRCRAGTATCTMTATGSSLGPCLGAIGPGVDECATGIDEDCDGMIDEGCAPPPADCTVADVLFLVDVTGSMGSAIGEIRRQLGTEIAPALDRSVGDLRMAVASYQDFPVGSYGSPGDNPFQIRQRATNDLAAIQSACDGLSASGGNDEPESATEALYQAATSAGLSGLVAPAACSGGGVGQACFRPSAQPIIVLVTDAHFHNGPGGSNAYSGVFPTPHRYDEALAALHAIDARVVGVAVNTFGFLALDDLRRVATDTGAVDATGAPIVVDATAGSGAVVDGIVNAVRDLCGR